MNSNRLFRISLLGDFGSIQDVQCKFLSQLCLGDDATLQQCGKYSFICDWLNGNWLHRRHGGCNEALNIDFW